MIETMRATELWQMTGAFSVRIQGMARQHNISLRDEFDEHDGPGTRYIVLLDDGYPIGTCRFYEISEKSVMLGRVVVLGEYRNKGLGKRIMMDAEQWIKELGYECIVIESRLEVVEFYERLGYIADNENIIHGCTFTCIHMEKNL